MEEVFENTITVDSVSECINAIQDCISTVEKYSIYMSAFQQEYMELMDDAKVKIAEATARLSTIE